MWNNRLSATEQESITSRITYRGGMDSVEYNWAENLFRLNAGESPVSSVRT